ncbi:MAG: hypothetical protein ACLQBX_17070 [Candidatus Limnocylindrales bacterium]
MTALGVEDIFERAISQLATPTRLGQSLPKPLLSIGQDPLWRLDGWPLRLPEITVDAAPDVQQMTRELRQWTAWSARDLAEVLGTSHTTILAVEDGRPLAASRSGELRQRLIDVHEVVSRIFVLSERNPQRTAHALGTPTAREPSAQTYLIEGQPAKAYVAALDVLRPSADGLLVGSRPAAPGRATAPLHD